MKGLDPVTEKCPILLLEDLGFALKQLSSIIKDDDYEGLGNHATGVMGETSIFILAQVCSSVPFFFFFSSYYCLVLTFVFYSCWR